MPKNIEKRLCKYNQEEFFPLRNSQIFASKENRVAFFNDRNNATLRKLNVVNKKLLKNFKIAEHLVGKEKEVVVNRHFLRGMGWSFNHFTHVHQTKDNVAYGIYNYIIQKINTEEYIIQRKS